MYKVCFMGVGSIAERHIQNLSKLFRQKKEDIHIDVCRTGKGKLLSEDIKKQICHSYSGPGELPYDYDTIFITNPTEYHLDTLQEINDRSKNFFIEKPLTSVRQMDKLNTIRIDTHKIYYVACPLRYTKVIQYIQKNVLQERIYSIRCISSSYLPQWRPGQDYRESYSAHKDMGGGVSIDLIHEWDYIKYLFGKPQSVQKLITNVSDLAIDSDDLATYIAEYEDKVVELHLDYFGRAPMRQIQLFGKEDTIVCDLIRNQVCYLREQHVIDCSEERNDYQMRELSHFIDIINGKSKNRNTLKDAYETLLLTQGRV